MLCCIQCTLSDISHTGTQQSLSGTCRRPRPQSHGHTYRGGQRHRWGQGIPHSHCTVPDRPGRSSCLQQILGNTHRWQCCSLVHSGPSLNSLAHLDNPDFHKGCLCSQLHTDRSGCHSCHVQSTRFDSPGLSSRAHTHSAC